MTKILSALGIIITILALFVALILIRPNGVVGFMLTSFPFCVILVLLNEGLKDSPFYTDAPGEPHPFDQTESGGVGGFVKENPGLIMSAAIIANSFRSKDNQ